MDPNYIAYEALQASREAAEWAYWSMIGTWLAGFATVGAVASSLYIANMRPKPRIKGNITLSAIKKFEWKKGVGINIANVGHMPVSITSLVWHFDGETTFMHDFAPEGQNLPIKLEHGETGFFFIENDQHSPWARDVKNFILENHGKIERLRIAVNFGTMDRVFIKPAEAVIKMIQNA